MAPGDLGASRPEQGFPVLCPPAGQPCPWRPVPGCPSWLLPSCKYFWIQRSLEPQCGESGVTSQHSLVPGVAAGEVYTKRMDRRESKTGICGYQEA